MPEISIVLQTPAWPELDREKVLHTQKPIGVTLLEGGMASGAHSVALRIDLEDGRTVIAETSLSLFLMAADTLRAQARTNDDKAARAFYAAKKNGDGAS